MSLEWSQEWTCSQRGHGENVVLWDPGENAEVLLQPKRLLKIVFIRVRTYSSPYKYIVGEESS